jgi:hypothetical protein
MLPKGLFDRYCEAGFRVITSDQPTRFQRKVLEWYMKRLDAKRALQD